MRNINKIIIHMCPSESYTWGLTVGENYNDSNKYVPFRAFNLTPYMDDMRAVGR